MSVISVRFRERPSSHCPTPRLGGGGGGGIVSSPPQNCPDLVEAFFAPMMDRGYKQGLCQSHASEIRAGHTCAFAIGASHVEELPCPPSFYHAESRREWAAARIRGPFWFVRACNLPGNQAARNSRNSNTKSDQPCRSHHGDDFPRSRSRAGRSR